MHDPARDQGHAGRQLGGSRTALFMWTTDPMLRHALDVIDAWGFTYKTVAFYWVKLNKGRGGIFLAPRDFFTGMGFWTRANPELCLLATRGKPRRQGTDVAKLLIAARREHSRKPDETYRRIERLVDGPYLELFARTTQPGWDMLGNQAGLFDGGPVGPVAGRRAAGAGCAGLTIRCIGHVAHHPGGRIGQPFPGLRALCMR